jgi:hypothetical protein
VVPRARAGRRQRRGAELELTELRYPARSLLVIGGPPGAGKSTLAARAVRGAPVLDLREWAALRGRVLAGEELGEELASVRMLARPDAAAVERIVLADAPAG